jgi:hypothetical protein
MPSNHRYARLQHLVKVLGELLTAIAEQEAPRPQPPPVPPRTSERPTIRLSLTSDRIEVLGPDGTWQPARFIHYGYEPDGEGGYWRPLSEVMTGPPGRYIEQRLGHHPGPGPRR